jgi:polar amino acid transport system substrate-binding protein
MEGTVNPIRALVCVVVAWSAAVGSSAETAAPARETLRVAALPIAGALDWAGDHPTGLMIDVWEDLAGRLEMETEFIRVANFRGLLDDLAAGHADVALGPIAITEEREKQIDFTHPIFHSGMRIAVRQRVNSGLSDALGSMVSWQLLQLVGAVVGLVLLSGHLLWWFERDGNQHSFPRAYPRGVWEAIWWIASTIVTGGCDDKHVDSVLGRAIAFVWMVGGIGLIAVFTSMLTASMTADRVTGTIHGPRDLAGRTVGCQERAVAVDVIRQRGGQAQEFVTLLEAADALALGMVDAVVGENQQMMYLVRQRNRQTMKLVGPIFESFDYGLGLPQESLLRERLNSAILRMREDGSLERMREQWLGTHD